MRTATRWASVLVATGAPGGASRPGQGGRSWSGRRSLRPSGPTTLTFAPLDNYSIFQPTTTITLTGLFGVTTAAGPTSTDFPQGNLDTTNLN